MSLGQRQILITEALLLILPKDLSDELAHPVGVGLVESNLGVPIMQVWFHVLLQHVGELEHVELLDPNPGVLQREMRLVETHCQLRLGGVRRKVLAALLSDTLTGGIESKLKLLGQTPASKFPQLSCHCLGVLLHGASRMMHGSLKEVGQSSDVVLDSRLKSGISFCVLGVLLLFPLPVCHYQHLAFHFLHFQTDLLVEERKHPALDGLQHTGNDACEHYGCYRLVVLV
mmetsp:Transcript_74878/g.178099  ORF Transcript_74878/g.178099 Transcript_74878/m.178099 type:complete len:229 (+) Transcript_74878:1237-1923(+)